MPNEQDITNHWVLNRKVSILAHSAFHNLAINPPTIRFSPSKRNQAYTETVAWAFLMLAKCTNNQYILLMERPPANQLRLVVIPRYTKVLYFAGGWLGFLPSTVACTQNYWQIFFGMDLFPFLTATQAHAQWSLSRTHLVICQNHAEDPLWYSRRECKVPAFWPAQSAGNIENSMTTKLEPKGQK